MRHPRPDSNKRELVDFWRRIGCVVLVHDVYAGCDLTLVCPKTGVHLVELKTPATRADLTPREKKLQAELEEVGGKLEIVCDLDEAARLAGV